MYKVMNTWKRFQEDIMYVVYERNMQLGSNAFMGPLFKS